MQKACIVHNEGGNAIMSTEDTASATKTVKIELVLAGLAELALVSKMLANFDIFGTF